MPRLSTTYRDESYTIEQRPDLATGDYVPWCLNVDGAWYQLTDDATDAGDSARRFLRNRMRSAVTPRTPAFLGTIKHPLLLVIDGVTVRAWSQFVARGTGAKTFVHPTLNRRVATERGPVWIFSTAAREASEGGLATTAQTVDDVRELGAAWLRTSAQSES